MRVCDNIFVNLKKGISKQHLIFHSHDGTNTMRVYFISYYHKCVEILDRIIRINGLILAG